MAQPVRDTGTVLHGQEARPGEFTAVRWLTGIQEKRNILRILSM